MSHRIRFPNESHAIKNMAFAIGLETPLEGPAFRAAQDILRDFAEELPKESVRQAITTTFDSRGGASVVSKDIGGVTRSRVKPDGSPAIELQVEADHIAVLCGQYGKWTEQLKYSQNLLRPTYQALCGFSKATYLALQYNDEFYFDGEISDWDFSLLFRSDSIYITPASRSARDLWHSHFGAFQDGGLTNVNIDVVKTKQRPASITIQVHTGHRMPLNSNSFEESFDDDFVSSFSAMHDNNKRIMRDLLSPVISKRIGLI